MSEEIDRWIHQLSMPKLHLALLPRDGSREFGPDAVLVFDVSGGILGGLEPKITNTGRIGGDSKRWYQIYVRHILKPIQIWMLPDGTIQSYNRAGDHLYFQAYDTAYRNVMDMHDGLVDIPRCGDITFLAGEKFLSDVLIDDTKKLKWSDVEISRLMADVLYTPDSWKLGGVVDPAAGFKVAGVAGVDGTFDTADGKTVTVTKGLITSIV